MSKLGSIELQQQGTLENIQLHVSILVVVSLRDLKSIALRQSTYTPGERHALGFKILFQALLDFLE